MGSNWTPIQLTGVAWVPMHEMPIGRVLDGSMALGHTQKAGNRGTHDKSHKAKSGCDSPYISHIQGREVNWLHPVGSNTKPANPLP